MVRLYENSLGLYFEYGPFILAWLCGMGEEREEVKREVLCTAGVLGKRKHFAVDLFFNKQHLHKIVESVVLTFRPSVIRLEIYAYIADDSLAVA